MQYSVYIYIDISILILFEVTHLKLMWLVTFVSSVWMRRSFNTPEDCDIGSILSYRVVYQHNRSEQAASNSHS
jgi:hypothetical protein